ncbi:hypothetical protein ACHQM5_010546 [Ranunculus cassubicifolius]
MFCPAFDRGSDRLQSLNSVLHLIEEVSGFNMDIPEISDPLLKPWHLPCPSLIRVNLKVSLVKTIVKAEFKHNQSIIRI